MFLVLQLGVWSVVSSQDVPPFGQDLEFLGEEFPETEQLPQFQIEVLAFAYNAFDSTEEQFHREPRPAPPDAVPTGPLEPVEALPPGGIDPYQPLPVWPPRETEPAQPPEAYPGFGDPQTENELEPVELQERPLEEQLSISEQILSTLLTLEEEPDPLSPFDPLNPVDPLDPGNTTDPLDPYAQETPTDPAPGDLIAVEDTFGSGDPLQSELLDAEPAEEPFQFRFLSRDELELTAAFERLDNLGAYTVLVHGGWVQEGLPEDGAHPFDLSLLGALNPVGTVQVHLSRFLHVTVALDYRATPPRPATSIPPRFATYNDVLEEFSLPPQYELRTTRRTRSGELHYFDHPAFGLLVIVRPAPEVPEDSEETDESLNPPLGPAA